MCIQKLSRMLICRTRPSATWDLMVKYNINTNVASTSSIPETFTNQCQDQMVKIDSQIYHLNRLKSSLKSDYFERIFTSSDFEPKINDVLEIQLKRSEVFPSIIDLIGGKNLFDVLSSDNLIPLLETMDHLEMEIDLAQVERFIDENSESYSPQDAKIFELYDFIKKNEIFEYLFGSVFKHFSTHLTTLQNSEIFPNLPLGHLIRIIKCIEKPNDEVRCKIIEMCTKWFCHDMENRLPHMLMLINSIKPEFNSDSEKNSDDGRQLISRLPKCDVDEQAKQKIISRCLFSFLAYGGKLNPTIIDRETLSFMNHDGYESDYHFAWTEETQYEVYEDYDRSEYINAFSENYKLRKYLKNGDFYDITVRLGEKTYKLHRSILESESSYFLNIFRTEYAEAVAESGGTLPITCPSRDKEYLLDDRISPSVFDMIIKYVYFGDDDYYYYHGWSVDMAKAVDYLGIDQLSKSWTTWFKNQHESVSSQDVIEILNLTRGKTKYEDLHSIYFCKYMSSKSLEIDKVPELGSFSWTRLENMLKSPNFLPEDPHVILELCSKWIIHDVQNRYCLIPKIVQLINPFCVVDHDKFTNSAENLSHCSEQLIRDKLWEILSSVSHTVLSTELSENENTLGKSEQIPVFIGLKDGNTVDILNADLDIIDSLSFSNLKIVPKSPVRCPVSVAVKNDGYLYIVSSVTPTPSFEIYHIPSKKRISLAFDSRLGRPGMIFTLLNINNEIYCCSENGVVMKYFAPFDKWMMIFNRKSGRSVIWYASDGEILCRMYDSSFLEYSADVYDFEKKKWSSVPAVAGVIHPLHMTVVNDHKLAVPSMCGVYLCDCKSNKFRCAYNMPEKYGKSEYNVFVVAPYEDRLLIMAENKLYQSSTLQGGKWSLKKELPLRDEKLPYDSFAAIHRPKIIIN